MKQQVLLFTFLRSDIQEAFRSETEKQRKKNPSFWLHLSDSKSRFIKFLFSITVVTTLQVVCSQRGVPRSKTKKKFS